jgi:hypothetical protein
MEAPYMSAVARTFRRDVFASLLIELVQAIRSSPLVVGVGMAKF